MKKTIIVISSVIAAIIVIIGVLSLGILSLLGIDAALSAPERIIKTN